MEIYIEKTGERRKLRFVGTVAVLLKRRGINPESVIVVREHEVMTERDRISDTDSVEILSVVSGG